MTEVSETCSAPNCTKPVYYKQLCTAHYQRARKGTDMSKPVIVAVSHVEHPECFHPGCTQPRGRDGKFCKMHYQRSRTGADMDAPNRKKHPAGVTAWATEKRSGYVTRKRKVDGRWITESQHRVVMAEILGRDLLPHESVHHINGDRADNRRENLELWSSSQPSGQRVADKLAWARQLIKDYGDLGGVIK